MKTMTAKYPGRCTACGKPIARGEQINFFGRGRAEHAQCSNAGQKPNAGPDHFDMAYEDECARACGL